MLMTAGEEGLTGAILTPYNAQAKLIKELIRVSNISQKVCPHCFLTQICAHVFALLHSARGSLMLIPPPSILSCNILLV